MSGVITTNNHPKLLWPGVYATWGQMYNEHLKEYPDLYEELVSEKAYEQGVQITGFGVAPVKSQGAPVQYDSEIQGIITTYPHITYALGYQVTMEEQMDNLYEEVSMNRAKALAFSATQSIEQVAAFVYNNGFVTTYYTTGDGVALLSSAHVNATGGTYSNILSPAADLAESSLEDLTVQIMGVTGDRGLNINIMPRSLHIPRQEYYNANRILKSVLQANTANNNINVLKAVNAFPEGIKLNHYFTAAHAWFIRTNCPRGMTMFWRKRPEFTQDNDFATKNLLAMFDMRFSVGATDPRGIFGSNGP